ncbi:MAG TPA: GAF domain-containing protein [Solirubrobacterales bacterium]|jgi:nitrate/nitrite-specific signal transduction histidine kinase|nr:GAF domain-containing protein [Solirubrobacterales bacterium]
MGNSAIATPRTGTVEVLVGLLADLDVATESGVFYDRVCRAVCTLTSMTRAAVLLHDPAYRTVIPVGSYGADSALVKTFEGTLDETPVARRALEEDRVVEVSGPLHGHVPDRYAELVDTACITCTPISAARRWLGVIFADRGGEEFALDEGERETMLTLGRLAALTASVEHSTEQRESERRLSERVELTRELHENAIQRLFGVALALGSERELSARERRRCQEELRSVVGDLRTALTRPVGGARRPPKASLGEVLDRLGQRRPELRVEWEEDVAVPGHLEPLAQSVLAEALRNADRHAEPSEIEVGVASDGVTFTLAVENDGAGGGRDTKGGGLGLRLAALEALRYEGLVEFGAVAGGRWRVRLVVPVAAP